MSPLCSALHLGEQFASITACGLHSPFSADPCAASSAAFPACHLPAPRARHPAPLRSPKLTQLQSPGSGGHSSQEPHPQPTQCWMLAMCGHSQGKGLSGPICPARLPSQALIHSPSPSLPCKMGSALPSSAKTYCCVCCSRATASTPVSHALYSLLPPNASRSSCLDLTVALTWDHWGQDTAHCPSFPTGSKSNCLLLEHWGLLATTPHCGLHSPLKGRSRPGLPPWLIHSFIEQRCV